MRDLTYQEWRDAGYYVRRGERATGRNKEGVATFTRDQVEVASEVGPSRLNLTDEERESLGIRRPW